MEINLVQVRGTRYRKKPNGLPESFIIAEDFIDNKPCCLILGDNFFFGSNPQVKVEWRPKIILVQLYFLKPLKTQVEFGVVSLGQERNSIKNH